MTAEGEMAGAREGGTRVPQVPGGMDAAGKPQDGRAHAAPGTAPSRPPAIPPSEVWEAVIGLEIHVQLATRSKMFCGNAVEFGAPPNTHVCPVCLGLPGALPVINAQAVRLAVRAALGLECTIHETSVFARKNYFYPDLPKGYQITQFDRPIATDGWVRTREASLSGEVPGRSLAEGGMAGRREGGSGRPQVPGVPDSAGQSQARQDPGSSGIPPSRDPALPPSADEGPGTHAPRAPGLGVRIRRIHLEEDAGKSIHDRFPGRTAVDLNRAGVPLVEIVTEPDIRSPAQAREFLKGLKQVLEYLAVSDCDMEKGSLRVDANVSLRPRGAHTLGTKTEVKNMNSFSNVERALSFEIERQTAELEAGRAVTQETLLWDAARDEARPMRSKEESHDYRYFPEPDLPPLVVARAAIEAERAALPELPAARLHRFVQAYGLPLYDADVLTASRDIADYYEQAAAAAGGGAHAKAVSNWVMGDVRGWANEHGCAVSAVPVAPGAIGELVRLVAEGTLSSTMARSVFLRVAETGKEPGDIVRAEGLAQVRDAGQLDTWVAEVVAAHPTEVERYRQGEERLLGFLMGQVMKKSHGKADPRQATELLRARLGR